MPPKKKEPAPIDRPLSRAYLREFTGWSTAYSPGLSDPTALSQMENCWVTRDGALAVRPALRSVFAENNWITTNYNAAIVGSFESFFLNDGSKALLFATKKNDTGSVVFRVASDGDNDGVYDVLTLDDAGFTGDPDDVAFSNSTTYVRYLQIDNKIFALPDSTDANDTVRIFHVGANKRLEAPREISVPEFISGHAPDVVYPEAAWINDTTKTTIPTTETSLSGDPDDPLSGTLVDNVPADNTFNFGYYYTFQNAFGETAPSKMATQKAKRGWNQWIFETADAAGGPSGTSTVDPEMSCDQLVVVIPTAAWNEALADGATGFNVYMVSWSDQGQVPIEGTLIGSKDLTVAGITQAKDSWVQHTPISGSYDVTAPLPDGVNRLNYSSPPSASQGQVAGDRVILVNDRQSAAVIRWSSNQLGSYADFSPSKGGGFKTLTAGNLLVPACVKLWQNPQSVDSLVVLCRGVDGYSTAYYMAPAQVTGQTASTTIMAFEETTATPGTVSPWGVDVVNQALYHPLDDQLMKSTASNYNINHKSMTEMIANSWLPLVDKHDIVSATLDNRIYYIVHNPDGEAIETGCMGNEIWVLDVAGPTPVWSRWKIQANSLHKLEVQGKIYMAVSRPEALFILDELAYMDQYSDTGETSERAIPWQAETHTQGANRAHDAWAHLRQVNIRLGNFLGRMRYGIRGIDQYGYTVDVSKVTKSLVDVNLLARPLPWDTEDFLLVQRELKEWRLYVESVTDAEGQPFPCYGQVNLVQYRYTPASVNIDGALGSVETFEYSRASSANDLDTYYPNGVPLGAINAASGGGS